MSRIGWVKRLKDGVVLDIPMRDMEATLKRGGFVEVKDPTDPKLKNKIDVISTEHALECPLCGTVCKTEAELKTHKKVH